MENWEKINAVQRMKDYIEEHIAEQITLHKLAKAANYSPWHAAKTFKELIGKTPFEYIRAIRLSRAAVKLRNADVKITDVAFDFVFDSHEGFTRAFSRQFGMTPQYFCRNAPLIKFFIPNNVRDYYLTLQKGVDFMPENFNANTVFVQVVDRPARKLILKRGIKAEHYWAVMKNYDPKFYGFEWADEDGPRFQLAPMGYRGYIEARPVKQISVK